MRRIKIIGVKGRPPRPHRPKRFDFKHLAKPRVVRMSSARRSQNASPAGAAPSRCPAGSSLGAKRPGPGAYSARSRPARHMAGFYSAVDNRSNVMFDGYVTERRHHIASPLTMLPSRSSLELSLRSAAFAASTLMLNRIRSSTVLRPMIPPTLAKFGMSATVRIGRSCR